MRPFVIGLIILAGCAKQKSEQVEPPQPRITDAAPTVPGEIEIGGFASPESVLHDTTADVYLVSNVNGGAHEVDDNGYISKVSPDGQVIAAKWIDGARAEIALDAPKGMAITGGTLWVTDITKVRRFDIASGTQLPDIELPATTFVNDVVDDGRGGVYASESGLGRRFESTGTDAIFHIDAGGDVTTLVKGPSLGRPNGLVFRDGALWVVGFGSGELSQISRGERRPIARLPKAELDGIAALDDELFISSWEARAIYRGDARGAAWKEWVTNVKSPADIGVDAKRRRVLVPEINEGDVLIVPLP